MPSAVIVAILAAFGAVPFAGQQSGGPDAAQAAEVEAGRRIYVDGVLPSGSPLQGIGPGDMQVSGKPASCASCHRRSGLGSVAGGAITPPVAGDLLFRPVWRGRPEMEMARTVGPNARPAYTEASLAKAVAAGVGANGAALDRRMPRYALAHADMRALSAYLKTLSAKPSAGADAATVRFATIVAGDVAPARRKALLDVVETFVREKNGGTRYEARRRTRPPMDMEVHYALYRNWAVDVWNLTGPPSSWREQLDALYRKQPVFAVLSGVANGPWAPIHQFCEVNRVPCAFPVTDLPEVRGDGFYTIYFSRGATLEGEALADYVKSRPDDAPGPFVQIYREGGAGATAAAALARRLADGRGQTADIALAADEAATPAFWERVAARGNGATLAIWLEAADLAGIGAVGGGASGPARLYLSSSLAPDGAQLVPEAMQAQLRLVHRFEKPDQFDLRVQRTRAWLRSRKIADPREERTQAEAFFTLSIASEALMHNYNFFVREYLIEQFESMASSMVVTAYYPKVTFGVGQRFGSTGAYIVKPGDRTGSLPAAVSGWIVP